MRDKRERRGPGGGRDDISKACKVKPNTQQSMVLELLRQRPMSAAELQWSLPVADARAVVRDLIGKGYAIDKRQHPAPSVRGRQIQRYHLIES
ncbi:helix-turn-helix domain-containing protein [Halomonas dongshanensis]|uniref:Winged helix-turn-helix domain-containing protein n=1 Tax=Halomonas dongshanensis TaxID=2890835 RepID=A0ABT2EE69_9GAMM|nr:helix-turn-helix domain-containing protein [Halomonas dongshanensis]MCS2609380.1 hypothetical protein [Halomonas dongshanensis]